MKQLFIGVLLFLTFGCEVSDSSDLNQETSASNQNNTPLPNLEPNQYRFISFDGVYENGDSQRKSAISGAINWALLTPILDDASINLSSELVAVFGAIKENGFYIHKEQILGFSPEAMEQAG